MIYPLIKHPNHVLIYIVFINHDLCSNIYLKIVVYDVQIVVNCIQLMINEFRHFHIPLVLNISESQDVYLEPNTF